MPLWRPLERVRPRGAWAAAAVGAAFGAAAYAIGYGWLWRIVDVFLEGDVVLGAALWTAQGLWFAAGFAAGALLFHALGRRGWPAAVAGPLSWLALEKLQVQVFPVHAGNTLASVGPLVQVADLGGPLLLSGLVVAANAAALETWRWLRRERALPALAWAVGGLALLAALAYGEVRTRAVDAAAARAPALRVGMVQADLGLLEKRRRAAEGHRRHLEQTRALVAAGPLDLVVWPETAYVRGVRRPLPVSGRPVSAEIAVPLLFGGTSVRQEGGRRVSANSAFLVGADGWIRDAYDKNLLLPLAETPPPGSSGEADAAWLPHVQEFRPSRHTPPLRLGPWRLSTPICYEAIRPGFVRRMVAEARPHLLVNLSNDAWFGDSRAPWMHLALARLRAVEHRRYLVRSTNSGVSAVIDPAGRVIARTGLQTRENLRATVRLLDGSTPYGRAGDWPGALALAGTGLALLVRRPARAAPERLSGRPGGAVPAGP